MTQSSLRQAIRQALVDCFGGDVGATPRVKVAVVGTLFQRVVWDALHEPGATAPVAEGLLRRMENVLDIPRSGAENRRTFGAIRATRVLRGSGK